MKGIETIIDSKASKMNFMKGLILLAKADGFIEDNEKHFFVNAAVGLGLQGGDLDVVEEMIQATEMDCDIHFVNNNQALFFMREAMQLCYIDGSYNDREKEIIEEIRKNNSLPKESIERIEDWVVQGMAWRAEGDKLLNLRGE